MRKLEKINQKQQDKKKLITSYYLNSIVHF